MLMHISILNVFKYSPTICISDFGDCLFFLEFQLRHVEPFKFVLLPFCMCDGFFYGHISDDKCYDQVDENQHQQDEAHKLISKPRKNDKISAHIEEISYTLMTGCSNNKL